MVLPDKSIEHGTKASTYTLSRSSLFYWIPIYIMRSKIQIHTRTSRSRVARHHISPDYCKHKLLHTNHNHKHGKRYSNYQIYPFAWFCYPACVVHRALTVTISDDNPRGPRKHLITRLKCLESVNQEFNQSSCNSLLFLVSTNSSVQCHIAFQQKRFLNIA